ncbi:MAG: TusE/DsrC/DsvC family sulfur relay protein [Cellvibrionaceae bacterium]|nr:TusE/DsrC/DsvC family sulfur relay protein [Cellvibrionaceae bacterium]
MKPPHSPTIATDSQGYLCQWQDWSETLAEHLAQQEGIRLGPAHWEIIYLVRQFYGDYEIAPAMRPLVKYVAATLGKTKGNSLYLMTLFPDSPAKRVAKIAGLPRPSHCL